jgi:hypothetical protein
MPSINTVIEAIRVEVEVEEATATVKAVVVVVVRAITVDGTLVDKPMLMQPTAAIGPTTSRIHALITATKTVAISLITATKTVAISPVDITPTNVEMTAKTRHTTPIALNLTMTGMITVTINTLITTLRMISHETVTPMTDQ